MASELSEYDRNKELWRRVYTSHRFLDEVKAIRREYAIPELGFTVNETGKLEDWYQEIRDKDDKMCASNEWLMASESINSAERQEAVLDLLVMHQFEKYIQERLADRIGLIWELWYGTLFDFVLLSKGTPPRKSFTFFRHPERNTLLIELGLSSRVNDVTINGAKVNEQLQLLDYSPGKRIRKSSQPERNVKFLELSEQGMSYKGIADHWSDITDKVIGYDAVAKIIQREKKRRVVDT